MAREIELFGGPADGKRIEIEGWPHTIEIPIFGHPSVRYRMDLTDDARYQIHPKETA